MFLASINPSSDKSTFLLQKKKVSITKSVVKKQHKHHIFKFQCQVYGEHHILGESWYFFQYFIMTKIWYSPLYQPLASYKPFTYHLLPINHSYQTINHILICISNIWLRQVTSSFADDPAPPPATTRPPRKTQICGDPRGCWAQPSNQRPHPWTSGLLREKNPGKLISSGND